MLNSLELKDDKMLKLYLIDCKIIVKKYTIEKVITVLLMTIEELNYNFF